MNKKTITKILVLSVLLILFSLNIKASIFATIGMKGLSFASPQAAGVVQNVMKAYQITTDPSGFITGEMTGKITGEVMGEIAKQSPEAAKAIQQYQQVKEWVDEGAKITEDLKLDDKGQLVGGSATINKKQNVESITDKKISEVENMQLSSSGEGKPYQLKASENGASTTIGGNTYSNLQKGSTITVDRETGKIGEMDATFTVATTIKMNEDEIKVPKGGRVVYKNGEYEIYGKDQEVEINKQKIQINGENSINYDGKKITGKDFTYDEKRFTGIGDKPAEMIPVKEGYLLGKDTKMEDNRMIINSEKGDVLYSKVCENVAGFDNYISPCKSTLTMEGDGFSVQMKEGKHFGLDIEKNDVLKYEMGGGKVVINNGEQTVHPRLGKSVRVINGEIVTTYVLINGEPQELISPDSLYGDYDVAMSTKLASESFDEETIITTQNEQMEGGQVENAKENVYVCPVGLETSGAAVTGAFFTKKCPQSTTVTTTNPEITPGSAKKGDNWGGEKIIEVYDRTATSLVVHTEDASGNINIYRINTDGTVERKVALYWVVDKEYVLSDPEKKWFGLTTGSKAQDVISNQKVNKIDDTAKGVTEKIGGGAKIMGVEFYQLNYLENKLFDSEGRYVGIVVKQPDGTYATPEGAARYKKFPGGVLREIRY